MTDAEILHAVLAELPAVQAVYLFGSRASGDARSDSDVDVAIFFETPLDAVERWHIQERIASRLGTDVDLVDLRECSTVLRHQVFETGRLLLDKATGERQLFEAHALSDYLRLNDERAGILDDLRKRGPVHE